MQQFYHELITTGWIKRRNLYGPGLSDRSVRGCHLICRVVLDKAVEEQIICVNPAQFCKLPGESRRETQVLTREEMQQLLIQAKADSCYELLLLDLSIGLRRGELLALQWEDLDLQTGALQISRQVSRVRGKLTISPPKTDATVRTILLAPAVLEQLRRYRQEVYSRWMFPSPKDPDSPRDPLEVRKLLMRVLERGKYLKIRLHNIRALRHYGDGVRYECEDSLGGGGTRLRRDYTEHLHPCHGVHGPAGDGEDRLGYRRADGHAHSGDRFPKCALPRLHRQPRKAAQARDRLRQSDQTTICGRDGILHGGPTGDGTPARSTPSLLGRNARKSCRSLRRNGLRCKISVCGMGCGQTGRFTPKKINLRKKLQRAGKMTGNSNEFPVISGGDYWTRTSDLLRVKICQGGKQCNFTSLPARFDTFCLVYGNSIISAPFFPPDFSHSGSPFGSGTQIASLRGSSTAGQ